MSQTAASPETRLWTPAGFAQDDWSRGEEFAAAGTNGRVILPLKAFLDMTAEDRLRDRDRIGVELAPGDNIEQIAGLFDQLSLVALAFPAFSDGRSFSKAELVRTRYGYEGPLRATGQVLVDTLPHMLRVGFDEFDISNPVLLERLEKGDTGGVPLYYQPSAQPSEGGQGYSWRRKRL